MSHPLSQKWEKQKEQSARTLATYLRLLFETTNKGYIRIGISTEAYDLEVPYSHLLTKVLVEKGILDRKQLTGMRGNAVAYKWISTTEPSVPMAKAVIAECLKKLHKPSSVVTECITAHPPFIKAIVDPIESLKSLIGQVFFGVSRWIASNGKETNTIIQGKLLSISIQDNGIIYHLDTAKTCYAISKSLSELQARLIDYDTPSIVDEP
jgi:hypothetical protein